MFHKKPGQPWFPNPVGNVGGVVVPDRLDFEPLEGFRSWHVTPEVDGLALRSLHISHVWSNPETAVCYPQTIVPVEHDLKDAPYPSHSCGLYAQLKDDPIDEWGVMKAGKVSVFGTIAMTGRIIVCERGYKAQHARIVSGFFEVSCAKGGCLNPVVVVQPRDMGRSVLCWCTAHEPVTEPGPVFDADTWLAEAARQLTARYDTKFWYWNA